MLQHQRNLSILKSKATQRVFLDETKIDLQITKNTENTTQTQRERRKRKWESSSRKQETNQMVLPCGQRDPECYRSHT